MEALPRRGRFRAAEKPPAPLPADPLQDADHPIGQMLHAVRMSHLEAAFRRDPRDVLLACCMKPVRLPGQAVGPGEEGLEKRLELGKGLDRLAFLGPVEGESEFAPQLPDDGRVARKEQRSQAVELRKDLLFGIHAASPIMPRHSVIALRARQGRAGRTGEASAAPSCYGAPCH